VYAQLTRVVGPRNIVQTAHRLGIKSHLRNWFAIGLGAQAVNPLEMARAFAVFANGGKRIDGSILGDQPRVVDWVARKGGGAKQNRPVARQVMDPNDAAIETSILEGVVREGTGHRAALPDRVAAGKTGTTENYGDAWFVGYTPELVTAVWVGYPTRLRPMLTEFGGQPVAGGTYPAEIWKTFTESALKQPRFRLAEPFPSPSIPYASPKRVVWRNGRLMLDNGRCKFVSTVWYFSDRGPTQEANCKPNEVDVPRVVGQTLANAEARLRAQPLTPVVIYKPATPLQRTDIVIAQYPAGGTLSTYEKVTLVKAKALHGTVPRVVGLPVAAAKAKLARLRLDVDVKGPDDGRVVSQQPPAGVAAAPGARIKLVARGG
jgi:membrane peptidoglycan carboxypeptidase